MSIDSIESYSYDPYVDDFYYPVEEKDSKEEIKEQICSWKIFNFIEKILDVFCPKNPVTKNREIRIVTTSKEKKVGKIACSEFIDKYEESQDDELISKVCEIGKNIAEISDRKNEVDFEFHVLENDKINALSLPGGYVIFYDGLLESLEGDYRVNEKEEYQDLTLDDKIASVMGHEIVHISARHNAKFLERYLLVTFLGLCYIHVIATIYLVDCALRYHGVLNRENPLIELYREWFYFRQRRACEFEADKYGMQYMAKAGYNPKAALWLQDFFIELEEMNEEPRVETTHPNPYRRFAANQKTLEEIQSEFPLAKKI